ncbi:hypothetical protein CEXT_651261 [Caerostris extrusa]|uniref:Uncharacterized protein n=1 Tax=Caerostris extrusa TaxID=172846 RepID=A0AAV4T940_CAEEX|nr:hypothetical protein CEXT_651261 [Caerostris extrusa]
MWRFSGYIYPIGTPETGTSVPFVHRCPSIILRRSQRPSPSVPGPYLKRNVWAEDARPSVALQITGHALIQARNNKKAQSFIRHTKPKGRRICFYIIEWRVSSCTCAHRKVPFLSIPSWMVTNLTTESLKRTD